MKRIFAVFLFLLSLVSTSSVFAEQIQYRHLSDETDNLRFDIGFNAELSRDASLNGAIPLYYQVDYFLNEYLSLDIYHAFWALLDINRNVYINSIDNKIDMAGFSEMRVGGEFNLWHTKKSETIPIVLNTTPLGGSFVKISYVDESREMNNFLSLRGGYYRYTRSTIAYSAYYYNPNDIYVKHQNKFGANIDNQGMYFGIAWLSRAQVEIDAALYGRKTLKYFNKFGIDVNLVTTKLEDGNIGNFIDEDEQEQFFPSSFGARLFWEAEMLNPLTMRAEAGQRAGFKNEYYFSVGLGLDFSWNIR
jgi:hypothetical protein